MEMENKLVRYSRAGDAFHYRWAARRCLQLVYPKSPLRHVVIEGSKESNLAGEYVIDVAEYLESVDNSLKEIAYFQLKHTTKRKKQPFKLSDLKDTITGFAKRYAGYLKKQKDTQDSSVVSFSIVTNRPVAESFKQGINAIAQGKAVKASFQTTIKKYTKLNKKDLAEFCALLRFFDGEGNYDSQRYQLHTELAQLLAGTVDDPQIDSIVALVQDKVLPDVDGTINREQVLKRLGASSERDLFPAPQEFEKLDKVISRKQHETLRDYIINASAPVIIHAAGGVGKSVIARQIAQSLPLGSLGIVYDCFGGGRYRNRSEPRHRHRDALVQISNELASQQLCSPYIAQSTALDDQILRGFLARIDMAARLLRKANTDAILVILIDAADNAEMAAEEFSQACFVHELLRESMPDGCRLVALCRTERIDLLRPPANVSLLELEAFSEEETLIHLRGHFSETTNAEGLEFHRLTNNGNPRVQANALSLGLRTVAETLDSLGPFGTTVEKQIEAQLDSAIALVKDRLPVNYRTHIDAICIGLAALPPFIPLKVLAKAAEVDESTVKSFVADLGRPLWLSDKSVQFRDEPTETWFKQNFSATQDQLVSYITHLEPLAHEYSYVAETLPVLFLGAGKYKELIDLALSDRLLPSENPIDERNVRVYRLQFAFKAALKLKQYADGTKLALRAGEEVSGDKRQLKLLTKNVDLIAPLQYEQKVQELAFRGMLRSGWEGSENVYSAALLSSVDNFKGESRGYLRAAFNWLDIYFESRKKAENNHFEEHLEDDDIVEFVFAKFNLEGQDEVVDFILGWTPPDLIYRITKKFFRRLIDANNFAPIEEISLLDRRSKHLGNQYLMMAIAHELLDIGRFPHPKATRTCLELLASKSTQIPKPGYSYNDTTLSGLISLIEACAANKHSRAKILQVLKTYFPTRASQSVGRDFQTGERDAYLRAVALRCVLENGQAPEIDELLPQEFTEKKKNKGKNKKKSYRSYDQDIREFKENVGGLLPWYIVRARVLVNDIDGLFEALRDADKQSKDARAQRYRDSDQLLYEISRVWIGIFMLYRPADRVQVEQFFTEYLKENKQIKINDRVRAIRGAIRLDHLSGISRQLEVLARDAIYSSTDEGPETQAEWYIDLARAVLPASREDAAAYFNNAIEVVSKFGDEIVQRWEAVAALASRSAEEGHSSPELAYRFMRCAELIGDNVDREKHWNRNGAIRVCTRLSPVSALATLSRWRDREIGWFDRQLTALADEMVERNFLSPAVGWSLSTFFEDNGLDEFASLCIEKEPTAVRRQYILNTAIRDLRLNEAAGQSWQKLKQIAQEQSLNHVDLDDIASFYLADSEKKEKQDKSGGSNSPDESEPVDWAKIFDDLDLTTGAGIDQAKQRFDGFPIRIHVYKTLWQEFFKRVSEGDALKFLQALIVAESTDMYDIQTALSCIPEDWKQKVSIEQNWGTILEQIAKRFAFDFTSHWGLEYFLQRIRGSDDLIPYLRKGILEGLSSNIDLVEASTFFGFAEIVSPIISVEEATLLLDFALVRFELHINPEYAEGNWDARLEPPEDIGMAFSGFIWSALGSPRAETRWRAVHSIRRLAEMGCEAEIDFLIEWMKRDSVDAFGCHKFPFYKLHARQYLLIALARVSIDNSQIVKRHNETFSQLALADSPPHILIQKYSTQIALNIEKAFAGTYGTDIVEQLYQVGKSQMPVNEVDRYQEKVESYWHAKGDVDTDLKHLHGWDFDRYWFEPLGDVFGVAGEQVMQLATEVIIKEWHVRYDGSFDSDPRARLWSSGREERESWHDHGSYPRVDRYNFYLSYHSMMAVAAKLLQKMAVVKRPGWQEDENQWADWLHHHTLTRNDGRWLADRRDPSPLRVPEWTDQPVTKNWRLEIEADDFLKSIFFQHEGETWLNIKGSWEESSGERTESLYITSALVPTATSQSLLNALTTCSDPHDFKLPDYREEGMEFEADPFNLKGWIGRADTHNGLDEFDPYAAGISFPPYQIGDSVIEKLGLSADPEQRNWFLPGTDKASLVCEIWRTRRPRPEEEPARYGERLNASITFLKHLCSVLDCEIILEVQINRRFSYNSYRRNEDDGYGPTHSKVYILSATGNLRDAETHYEVR